MYDVLCLCCLINCLPATCVFTAVQLYYYYYYYMVKVCVCVYWYLRALSVVSVLKRERNDTNLNTVNACM